MAGHLMLLNPKRRRRRMTAKQRKFFGPRRRKSKRRAAAKVVVVSSNPRRRRRRSRVVTRKMRRNPKMSVRTIRRRFRRNPVTSGFLNSTLAPAAIGAAGAIATDYLMGAFGQSIIPASLNTPMMQPVIRIGAALLVGLGVDAIAGSKAGTEAAAGGIVVALYNFANQQLLSGYGMGMGYGAGAGYGGQQYGLNRYMGFIRRGGNIAALNQRRALNGLAPIGVQAGGLSPLNTHPGLGAGPSNVTKFRVPRGGGGRMNMGYIGPAKTLGRYTVG